MPGREGGHEARPRFRAATPRRACLTLGLADPLSGFAPPHRDHLDPRFGTAREVQVQFVCDFTWKDLRTGQILIKERDFRVTSTFIPPGPYREDFFLGSEDVVNLLSERIVEKFAQPW